MDESYFRTLTVSKVRRLTWDEWWYYQCEEDVPFDNSKTNCYECGIIILREDKQERWIVAKVVSRENGGISSIANRRLVCSGCSRIHRKLTSCERAARMGYHKGHSFLQNIRNMEHVLLVYARKKEKDAELYSWDPR